MRELAAAVSKYLAETKGRMGDLARMGKEFGRFDPSEFPFEFGPSGGMAVTPDPVASIAAAATRADLGQRVVAARPVQGAGAPAGRGSQPGRLGAAG